MAESILRNIDPKLDIHSAGLDPVDHVSPIAIEIMKESGIDLQQNVPKKADEFADRVFDYLITVGESTSEEIEVNNIRFRRKMHLGLRSPYLNSKSQDEVREKCRKVRDELLREMDYFYHHILWRDTGMNEKNATPVR